MKKIVIGVLASSFLLSGTVFAATNGFFQGHPIINVTVEGNKVQGDTPAIELNGRTMVPLRFISETLGGQVDWNSTTKTVSVVKPTYGPSAANKADIQKLKDYMQAAEFYLRLQEVDTSIKTSEYEYAALIINKDYQFQNGVPYGLASVVKAYNDMLQASEQFVTWAQGRGIDVSDVKNILSLYYDAIEKFKSAYKHIGTTEGGNEIVQADQKSSEAAGLATQKYDKFKKLISDY